MKKRLKRQGVDTCEYLKELQTIEQRDKHLARIFNKDYNKANEIIQEAIGLEPQPT